MPTSPSSSADDAELSAEEMASSAADAAKVTLGDLQMELNRLQRTVRLTIQDRLAKLTGQSLGSLAENREMAKAIHQMLDSHGLRVQCSECGHPAILRASPRGGVANGVFVFDHTIERRRTFHGGKTVLPELRLVSKPARKQSSDRAVG
ncbi:hypothetical protein [Stieleria marina]|uniref:Uncharacterized protein n=1 Tax=Stieleria marina TaxID=1930275 RepID=A0A517NMJ1_9BACT|nr:hypothetical protein K239x_02820 [Planctomycetes bacterium K23_9]